MNSALPALTDFLVDISNNQLTTFPYHSYYDHYNSRHISFEGNPIQCSTICCMLSFRASVDCVDDTNWATWDGLDSNNLCVIPPAPACPLPSPLPVEPIYSVPKGLSGLVPKENHPNTHISMQTHNIEISIHSLILFLSMFLFNASIHFDVNRLFFCSVSQCFGHFVCYPKPTNLFSPQFTCLHVVRMAAEWPLGCEIASFCWLWCVCKLLLSQKTCCLVHFWCTKYYSSVIPSITFVSHKFHPFKESRKIMCWFLSCAKWVLRSFKFLLSCHPSHQKDVLPWIVTFFCLDKLLTIHFRWNLYSLVGSFFGAPCSRKNISASFAHSSGDFLEVLFVSLLNLFCVTFAITSHVGCQRKANIRRVSLLTLQEICCDRQSAIEQDKVTQKGQSFCLLLSEITHVGNSGLFFSQKKCLQCFPKMFNKLTIHPKVPDFVSA